MSPCQAGVILVSTIVKEQYTMQPTQLAFSQSSILFETLAEKIYIEPYYTSLRETLANALDIHKVVCTDRKVDMDLSSVNSYGMVLVTIRDYGTGIAPESYHEAYTFFGSNKAVSQQKLSGEYGLGAKSPYGILYRNNKLDNKIKRTHWICAKKA